MVSHLSTHHGLFSDCTSYLLGLSLLATIGSVHKVPAEDCEEVRSSQVVLVVKNPPAIAGDIRDSGSIPGSGRSPAGEHGNQLQYFCIEKPIDREAWWATVHRVAKRWK